MLRIAVPLTGANIIYLITAHTLSGRIVSSASLVAALCLALVATGRVQHPETKFRPPTRAGWSALAVVLAVPAVLMWIGRVTHHPVLNIPTLVMASWLGGIAWASSHAATVEDAPAANHEKARQLPWMTAVSIACATCFWLSIIWAVGAGQVVTSLGPSDRLTRNFELWETKPARQHLFLGWLDAQQFEQRQAYTNHLHPYLFFMYGSAKAVQLATGVSLRVGVNVTPFILMAIGACAFAFALAAWRAIDVRGGPIYHLTLVLAVGVFVLEWHYWSYLYTTNLDSIFPLVIFLGLFVWAAAVRANQGGSSRTLVFWAAVFGAFGWVYVPLLVVALWCYFGRADSSGRWSIAGNATLVRASAVCCTSWIVAYSLPRALVWLNGYSSVSSSFMFRSGLDGDRTYFQDIAQAVFRPTCCQPRSWWTLLFPAFAGLLAYAIWALWNGIRDRQVLAVFLFLSAPYFLSLAVIPQAVAIHPYLFDQLLFLPAVLVAALTALSGALQERLSGPTLLGLLLIAVTLIMTNLIEIAQVMRSPVGG